MGMLSIIQKFIRVGEQERTPTPEDLLGETFRYKGEDKPLPKITAQKKKRLPTGPPGKYLYSIPLPTYAQPYMRWVPIQPVEEKGRLIISGPTFIAAYSAKTGKEIWANISKSDIATFGRYLFFCSSFPK